MFTDLTTATLDAAFASTETGLCLCFKKLCPHCKNMEKVLEKYRALEPDVRFFRLDTEEQAEAAAALGAERAPTLIAISRGKPVAKKAGLMNPRELQAWVAEALDGQA